MLSIARLFLPGASNWDDVKEFADREYGPGDQFAKLLSEVVPSMKLVLNLRDALEHQNKGVTVRDFAMEPDGSIAPPTVELNFRKSVLPRKSVSSFMEELVAGLPIFFEMMVVHLSSKFAQPVGGLPLIVDLLPAEYQGARFVRFGYFTWMGDQKVHFG